MHGPSKPEISTSFRGAIARVTSILAIPYGFTVTLWAAAALAFARLGPPRVPDVFLFVLGACAGFIGLAVLGSVHLAPEAPMRVPAVIVFNAFPIVTATAVAILPLTALGRPFGYLAASFLATAAYVLCVAALVRVGWAVRGTGPE
jgi:hypothetical protein